jgi:hypothetical protein
MIPLMLVKPTPARVKRPNMIPGVRLERNIVRIRGRAPESDGVKRPTPDSHALALSRSIGARAANSASSSDMSAFGVVSNVSP